MAKTRKVFEAEADALFLSSEEIEGATTNADLTKLISENQPDEGYIFIELTQEMIDEDPDEYADYEVGDIVEVEIEEEEEEEEEEKPEEVQFEEGDLFFKVSEHFFGGGEITPKQLIELTKEADSINFFGNQCTNFAIKEGLISESSVIIIHGVRHAQAYTL